jgi:citrate lyase gamma subunit
MVVDAVYFETPTVHPRTYLLHSALAKKIRFDSNDVKVSVSPAADSKDDLDVSSLVKSLNSSIRIHEMVKHTMSFGGKSTQVRHTHDADFIARAKDPAISILGFPGHCHGRLTTCG